MTGKGILIEDELRAAYFLLPDKSSYVLKLYLNNWENFSF